MDPVGRSFVWLRSCGFARVASLVWLRSRGFTCVASVLLNVVGGEHAEVAGRVVAAPPVLVDLFGDVDGLARHERQLVLLACRAAIHTAG